MATNINKIDCHQAKKLFYQLYFQGQVSSPAPIAKSSFLRRNTYYHD